MSAQKASRFATPNSASISPKEPSTSKPGNAEFFRLARHEGVSRRGLDSSVLPPEGKPEQRRQTRINQRFPQYMDVIIAGFGGQGVLLIGNLLAQAGMDKGRNVTFIPVYGAEMRGGTANCTVVVSGSDIGSPIIKKPLSLIIMNQPSLEKFQPRLQKNGVQIVNSSLVDTALVEQSRVRSVLVPANEIAEGLGNPRMANMVALGAYLAATDVLPLTAAQKALSHVIGAHYAHLIPKNAEALAAGYAAGKNADHI